MKRITLLTILLAALTLIFSCKQEENIAQAVMGSVSEMTFSAQDPPSFSYRLDKDGSGEEPLRLCTRILMDMKQLEIPQGE